MQPLPAPVPIDEDFISHVVYKGHGYTVHENHDNELHARWFTLQIPHPATPATVKAAMGWFDDDVVVIESESDESGLWLDLAVR